MLKGKKEAIESNEDMKMLDGDEDLRGRSTLVNVFIFFSPFFYRTDHLKFSSPPRIADVELVLKMSLLKVLIIADSRGRRQFNHELGPRTSIDNDRITMKPMAGRNSWSPQE